MAAAMVDAQKIWAITSYFNPEHFESRRSNYAVFRARLGVPLITVELGTDGVFELHAGAADVLCQIRHGDTLWQKERLLNVALEHLPPSCEVVAWIDCDVVFADPSWPLRTLNALRSDVIVQLFDELIHLGRGDRPETARTPSPEACRQSFASAFLEGTLSSDFFRRPAASIEQRRNCGMAWAARREFVDRYRLYDGMVMGMGDKQMAAAAIGQIDEAIACLEMSPHHAQHFRRWAEAFALGTRGRVGVVPGTLYHLWHGDLSDRNYVGRYDGFKAFGFDPAVDLVRSGEGAWLWAGRRDLARHVADYFRSRREDGEVPTASAVLG